MSIGSDSSRRRSPGIVSPFSAVVRPIQAFFRLEAASGILLLACAVCALAWVNLGGAESYSRLLRYPLRFGAGDVLVRITVHDLVNDGLMTLFFLVVGMEIKRELTLGELRAPGQAALPAIAAAGGMLLPALIFLAFNRGGPGRAGWGIPTATDIAFCIGVLRLVRARVPHGLIVFVTALAIFDDIGGILIIAFFYGQTLSAAWLAAALAVTGGIALMARARVRNAGAYGAVGALLWYALHAGGIHPTVAGVVLGLAIPASPRRRPRETLQDLASHTAALLRRPSDEELDCEAIQGIDERLEDLEAPLTRFVHMLHPWVAFVIVPLFALANSGVDLRGLERSQLTGPVAVGTAVALLGGKLLGIFAFTAAAVKARIAPMPGRGSWAKLAGVSIVAGIGFTVALFITRLAYPGHPEMMHEAKLGILAGSLLAGIAGAIVLRLTPTLHQQAVRRAEPTERSRLAT